MRHLNRRDTNLPNRQLQIRCASFRTANLVRPGAYATFLACRRGRASLNAMIIREYGPPLDVLQLREVATPEPTEAEVLVKLYASSVNPLDGFTIRGPLFFFPKLGRLLKPTHKIAGADYAGRIESIGRDIKRFQPGDEVFGASFTGKGQGGFAEYVCTRENSLAPKPSNLSFEQAAAVPVAAITALQGLRDHGQIQPGQKVLIDGASGGVGTFAVQIAKSFGAEVTAVCSPRNVARARSIGADHVIDYTRENFTRSGLRYDLILGANAHHSIFDYRRALNQDGTLVWAGGGLGRMFQAISLKPLLSLIGNKKMRFFIAKINGSDLLLLKDLLEAGKIVPVIDRRYPLGEVAEALRYREEGHAQGKVVITIRHDKDVQASV
jgi:NADPH:quinone reductase-like Zn-dependent oxidoreductase